MSDNTPLSPEERQAIAARAARIAEMSTEDDCEYVELVKQLADSDIPRLQAHIEALEVAEEDYKLAADANYMAAQQQWGIARDAFKRIEALEKALGFYADEANYVASKMYMDNRPTGEGMLGESIRLIVPIRADRGKRAREVLR